MQQQEMPMSALALTGRACYVAGLVMVLAAMVMWFIQAQAPEAPIENEESDSESSDEEDDEGLDD